jgi:hypothetical protein
MPWRPERESKPSCGLRQFFQPPKEKKKIGKQTMKLRGEVALYMDTDKIVGIIIELIQKEKEL